MVFDEEIIDETLKFVVQNTFSDYLTNEIHGLWYKNERILYTKNTPNAFVGNGFLEFLWMFVVQNTLGVFTI